VHAILDRRGLDYTLDWLHAAAPFLTAKGELVAAVRAAVRAVTGIEPELSTTGGTSDGRFIIDICPQVLELGPVNASIHKLNEHIELAALDALKSIYRQVLERLLLPA
jgi:succinyl-diaminopimelate desuccinylase